MQKPADEVEGDLTLRVAEDEGDVLTLRVIEDRDCTIHVEYRGGFEDSAESMGGYLWMIARAIAVQHTDHLVTNREDGDLLAAICAGFMGPFLRYLVEKQRASK